MIPSSDSPVAPQIAEATRLLRSGRPGEAVAALDRVSARAQSDPEFHTLYAMASAHRGDRARALASFEAAARLAPRDPRPRVNLGGFLLETGATDRAYRAFGEAIDVATAPAHADALVVIANTALAIKDHDLALRALERAEKLRPGDFEIATYRRRAYTELIPAWHFPMMNDQARNEAYAAALGRAIGPETEVLEIGTGSGLLAMLAARAGARRVTTCEMVAPVAHAAAEIVARNGFADRVSVVAKRSQDLVVGVDLPRRADLLVSEILSSELLAEHVLPTIADARQRLLAPGAPMIPRAVAVMARLVGGAGLEQATGVGRVMGFDLSPFNRFRPSVLALRMETSAIESMSDDVEVFKFDLSAAQPRPEERVVEFAALRAGAAVGVLQWIRLYLDDVTVFENRPTDALAASGWKHMLFVFVHAQPLIAGGRLAVRARHNVMSLAFQPARG